MAHTNSNLPARCIAEALATGILCFVGAGSVVADAAFGNGGLVVVALANGLVLAALVSATLNVSGAHINPAVTLVMLVTRRIGLRAAAAYIAAQLAGAAAGGGALLVLFQGVPGGGDAIAVTALGATLPGAGVSAGTALLAEAAITFILVFVIFGTAVDSRAPAVGGFGIGVAVAANILLCGPISGASMNPARSFGPALAGGVWTAHWVYWAGPLIGALLAGLLYHHVILGAQDARSSSAAASARPPADR